MSQSYAVDSLEDYQDHLNYHAELGAHRKLLEFREWYMKFFLPPQGGRILDIGGYTGATAIHYAEKGHEVVSVEAAKVLCEEFRKNTKHLPNVTLVQSLIENYIAKEPFDACCCTEILNHVIDPLILLGVAHKSLKDTAEMFVTVTNREFPPIPHISQDELGQLLWDAGFNSRVKMWDDGMHTGQFIAWGQKR